MRRLTGCLLLMCALVWQGRASDTTANTQPKLVVLPSEYVKMMSESLLWSDGVVRFEGTFIVRGEGVYGHFDLCVYDESGEAVVTSRSDDLAYRRDRGARVKSIAMSVHGVTTCSRVEVSFHEMRINPDQSACSTPR